MFASAPEIWGMYTRFGKNAAAYIAALQAATDASAPSVQNGNEIAALNTQLSALGR
jgi:hypothetical protein